MFRLTRVRTKLMVRTLLLVVLTFIMLGIVTTFISRAFLFDSVRTYYLATTRGLAAAIDGTRHAQLTDTADLESSTYQETYNLLHEAHAELPDVNWLFTVNYDTNDELFSYAVGSQQTERTTIWVETDVVELQIQVDASEQPYIIYNEQHYPVGQAITLDEQDRTLVLEPHEAHYTLYVNDTPLLELVSTSPLRGQTNVGPVDADHTEVMTTSTIFGTQSELYFFFSAPGDPIIIPGEPFFDTPAKLAMMKEVMQTNEARINQQLTDSIDGATLTAYAPIRDDAGEPVGLMVADIHDTQVSAFQWSVIEAFGIGFLIMLLIAVYGVYRIAHYISHPLEQLSAGVALVSHGNFSVPVVIDKDDEFGQLARDFNIMAQTIAGQHQALHQQQQTLQQRNMELERALAENARLYTNLEHLVQERTARLQTALEEVQATKAQIEQWMHARSDAVRAVVHDLNHTVQGIQSALDVWLLELQEQPLEAAVIESGQDRLGMALAQQRTLLQELRDAALLESGTLVLQPTATDFGALVRQVANQLQPRYDLGDCTLTVTVADDLPAAWCDPHRIQRVIYNVLENAFRYTTSVREDGLVQVCVTCAGDELVCTVQDNGRGIAPSDLARLGQKFARLARGEGDPEGMGLGLNFAIGIMRLSQGTLTLTSTGEEQGTTVTLRLPRVHQSPLLALEYLQDRHTTSETKE